MKYFLLITLFYTLNAFADKSGVPADPSSKLEVLESRLAILEKENDQLKSRVKILETKADKSATERFAEIMPKEASEKKSFFERFQREMKSESDRAHGPWTNPASWSGIRKRMSTYELRKVLGNPTRIKQSANPAVEMVYLYEGDLDADGSKESGYVNIKDKRIVSFQSPH